jgi:hypothetical protein
MQPSIQYPTAERPTPTDNRALPQNVTGWRDV